VEFTDLMVGITNQRETTLCWSRSSGKPLCNAIVWDDGRTSGVVRHFERKLEDEGIDIDEEDPDVDVAEDKVPPKSSGPEAHVPLGTGTGGAAFADKGVVVGITDFVAGAMGKMMEGLGLAGRGKEMLKRKRKGVDGLLDV
jgi:glycerol kinase